MCVRVTIVNLGWGSYLAFERIIVRYNSILNIESSFPEVLLRNCHMPEVSTYPLYLFSEPDDMLDSGSLPLMHEQKLKKHKDLRLQMTKSESTGHL